MSVALATKEPKTKRELFLERRVAELETALEDQVRENACLRDENTALRAQVTALEKRLVELEARLNTNSTNSGRPPSTDPPSVQRPSRPRGKGRSRGAQPGHPGTTRPLVPLDQVDHVVEVRPAKCENCEAPLPEAAGDSDPDPIRHQSVELPPPPKPVVTEHRLHGRTCRCCGKVTRAQLPPEVGNSAFGPRLHARVAVLTGRFRLSRREAVEHLEMIEGVEISLGSVHALEQATSAALEQPYREALEAVREAPVINADETGWRKGNKLKGWLWVATTPALSVFHVDRYRSKKALERFLGKPKGVVGSDRAGAYADVENRQVCWSHLDRDFKKFVDRGGNAAHLGEKLRNETRRLFSLWHKFKRGEIDRPTLRRRAAPLQARFHRLLFDGLENKDEHVGRVCAKLLPLWPAFWTFLRVEGVEPTNNSAERAVRPAVLWRKACFGSQSDAGATFVSRIQTVVGSLRKQKRRLLAFVENAIGAFRSGQAAPSLLPST